MNPMRAPAAMTADLTLGSAHVDRTVSFACSTIRLGFGPGRQLVDGHGQRIPGSLDFRLDGIGVAGHVASLSCRAARKAAYS